MSVIVCYFVLIFAGVMHYQFEGSALLSFFFSVSSLFISIQIISSKKNNLLPSLNNILIPITILFSIFICILFIEIIKGSFDPSFLLKIVQVIACWE